MMKASITNLAKTGKTLTWGWRGGHNYRLKIFEGAGPHEEEKIIMFIFPFLSLAFLFGLTDF